MIAKNEQNVYRAANYLLRRCGVLFNGNEYLQMARELQAIFRRPEEEPVIPGIYKDESEAK